MNNKGNHSDKINNLIEALSELASQDLEEAVEFLKSAGKDPDAILEKAVDRLSKLQSARKANLKQDREEEKKLTGADIVPDHSFEFISLDSESKTVVLKGYPENFPILGAENVYNALVKKKTCQGIPYHELKLDEGSDSLRFHSILKDLKVVIRMGAESASAEFLILVKGEEISINQRLIPSILSCGYVIVDKVWYPIDRESLEFAGKIMLDINEAGQMSLNRALEYYSKRRMFTWLKFDPEELNLLQITESKAYSGQSGLFVRDLYKYQKEGLQWLQYCSLNRIGGILGDDMGLGKTAQIIALISWAIEMDIFRNMLVVVPSTLIENWRREFAFFAPSIIPYVHHGSNRTGSAAVLGKHRVIITSYSMVINDLYLLNRINWGLVTLDEASLIKNPDSERRISLGGIPAEVRIAMSGTPVENSLLDLWSLADFVNPGYLGTRGEFTSKFIKKDIEITLSESDLPALRTDVSHIMLRRKKEDVLDSLPDKIDIHQALEMSDSEAHQYDQLREEILESTKGNADGLILKMIQKLRQFTTHPMLTLNEKPERLSLDLLASSSTKFTRTLELLHEIGERKEKVLIFTEYLDMIDAFENLLSERFSCKTFTIDGRVPVADRQDRIDAFSSVKGFSIMVLNPRTAGMGLNITAANHVIHYTRQWNPALEEQATARAYRNKQSKDVNVYYLYYANTIEEVIDDRLRNKAALSGEVISVTETEMSMEEYLSALSKSPLKI